MEFTFGIITTMEKQTHETDNQHYVYDIIDSIEKNNIPKDKYEIIIVGGPNYYQDYENVNHIEFDDVTTPRWITKKKNLITEHAKFENIVFSHDYIQYDKNWYKGFLKFGNDWDLCMCIHKAYEGHRFRDWLVWEDPDLCYNVDGYDHRIALPPYDYDKTNYMQISGFWWVAKKYVMEKDPLDENLKWGDAEDVEWSFQVRDKYKYVMNTNSIVEVLKSKRLSAYYVEGDDKYENKNWIEKYK